MKRREMKLLLEERFERIALLETRIDTMDQLVEGYRAREQAVLDAMQTAKENAAKALEQVQTQGAQIQAEAQRVLAEAEQTRLGARAEAEALLSDAISAANTLRAEAERKGLEVTATVRADSERMLRDAEIIKREYEEMVDSFNAMLEQNASELEITAARFAEFVKNRKIDRAEARLDGNAFYKSVGELSDAALPDASEDPALLMQNIYRIQNRPLPEDRLESAPAQEPELSMQAEEPKAMPEETAEPLTEVVTQSGSEIPAKETESAISDAPKFPIVDGSGADERKNATEPYSEAAWADEAQESESEPQAEFVKTFDDAFVKSDYTIHDDECSVMQADAERAFDTLMSGGEVLAGTAAATIPIAATLATEKLDAQPMEDAARAFDAYFDETLEQGGKTAQDGSPTEQATEPYSEAAWANEAQESESEPQAEFVKTFDDAFVKSDYTVRTDECSVMQADAERAFDTLISGGETLAGAAAATIPAAATLATEKLDAQPMEDAARAFDAYFDETLEQGGKTAQDGITTEPQGTAPEVALTAEETKEPESDQESISDEKLQELLDTIMSTDSAPAPETGDVPEPYSEKAWSRDSFSSDLEPQAEGALFGEQDVEPKKPVYAYSDDAQLPPVSSDAERAFDDYLANVASFTTPVPAAEPAAPVEAAAPQVPAEPEPYSEKAWSRDSFTSDSEPQAE
ncbi:MAG: hypothetical protein VB061_09825, partial [Christensenella sp.]|nr:hypothetical protein [Christensenella sp.]